MSSGARRGARGRGGFGRRAAFAGLFTVASCVGRGAPPPAATPPVEVAAAPDTMRAPPRRDTIPRRDTLVRRDTIPRPAVAAADTAAHRDTVPRADTLPRGTVAHRDSVRVCAGGDVSLGTNLDTSWVERANKGRSLRARVATMPDVDSLLAPLHPLFAGADLVLVNVEGAIGEGDAEAKCVATPAIAPRARRRGRRRGSPASAIHKSCYELRMAPAAAAAIRHLRDSAAVVGNVANNHSHDAGPAGFDTTRALLARAGVFVTGADTLATPVVTAGGDTIGVLGFHTNAAVPDARDLSAVRRHVARAVASYGRVIVTMHLGAEGAGAQHVRDTTEYLFKDDRGNPVAFARAAIDAGAVLVLGHGPHVLRGVEWRRGGDALVAYSLGNLVTYGAFTRTPPLDRGGILCATITPDGAARAMAFRSTRQRFPGVVSADGTHGALTLLNKLGRADFPLSAVRFDAAGVAAPPDTVAIARADSLRPRP